MQISATEAKNRFGYYLGQAEREPVHVMKNDRIAGVIVSAARYAELEALELAKSMDARNTVEAPESITPVKISATRKGDALVLRLPPMSVSVVRLQ